jgi:hypothetical protein
VITMHMSFIITCGNLWGLAIPMNGWAFQPRP